MVSFKTERGQPVSDGQNKTSFRYVLQLFSAKARELFNISETLPPNDTHLKWVLQKVCTCTYKNLFIYLRQGSNSSNVPYTHYVAQDGFELGVILLPQPPEYWDHRCMSPCLAALESLSYLRTCNSQSTALPSRMQRLLCPGL